MKNITGKIILILLCLFATRINSQDACFLWTKSIGSVSNEACNATTADASGNVYCVGTFPTTMDFDPGPGVTTLTSSGADAYILKLSTTGTFGWVKKFTSPSGSFPMSITLDNSNNIYITGAFNGTTDFDPGPSVYNLTSAGGEDIFVAKLDPNGNFLWAVSAGASLTDEPWSVSLDPSGNVLCTGRFNNTVDFDPGPGTFNLTSAGGDDIFVLKLSNSGSFIWAVRFGNNGNDMAYGGAADASGNVYTAGMFSATVDFDPGPGTFTLAAAGFFDAFISKLDASGSFVWAKAIGSASTDVSRAITIDASGNVIVGGSFMGVVDLDPGPSTYTVASVGNTQDAFILKLDPSGGFTWANTFGSAAVSGEMVMAVATDTANNIYYSGYFSGLTDFDPGPGTYTLSTLGLQDACIGKVTTAGNFQWTKSFGSANNEYVQAMAVDPAQNIYYGGGYANNIDFNPGPAVYTLTPVGGSDIFVGKYGQMATPTITASGPTGFCQGGNVILTSSPAGSYSWSTGSTTQSISVNIAGNYSIGVTNAGCTVYSSVTPIAVYPLPSITVNSGSICLGNSFTINPSGAATYTFSGGSPVVSPSVNTNYSVTGTSSLGCNSINTAISHVTVNALPLPTVSVNSGSICAGNSFTMIPSGAITYSFSGGSAVVSPTADASYSVTGTNSAGCVSASPAISNVTVFAYPLPTVSVNSGSICSGTLFTMTPSGALSYSYSGGSPVVSPSVTTSYSVTGTNSLGCASSTPAISTVTVFQSPTVGVNAGSICQGQTFTIFPVGAASYTVSGGSFVVTPSVTTNYSVIGTNTLGCQSVNTAVCPVTVNNNPTITVNSAVICTGSYYNLSPGGASTYTISGGSYIVNPTVTTSYTVSGTSTAGCVSASPAISTITVSPYPALSVPTGSICYGQSYSIVATGSPTYDISGGSALVSPSVSTFYTVSTTNTAGCTTSSPCLVVVQPLPTVNISPSSNPLCIGVTATLNAGFNAITYTWSNGSNSPSLVVSPITTTSYTLTGTGAYGCVNSTVLLLTVDACAGIESHAPGKDSQISLYPNPNTGIFTVEAPPPYDLSIFNSLGQQVFSRKGEGAEKNISIEALPAGIYIVRIKALNAVYDTRLVKTD